MSLSYTTTRMIPLCSKSCEVLYPTLPKPQSGYCTAYTDNLMKVRHESIL